jgi:hypothetical protein
VKSIPAGGRSYQRNDDEFTMPLEFARKSRTEPSNAIFSVPKPLFAFRVGPLEVGPIAETIPESLVDVGGDTEPCGRMGCEACLADPVTMRLPEALASSWV